MTTTVHDKVISEYLFLRETGKTDEPRCKELLGQLDGLFWKRVEKAVDESLASAQDQLDFAPADALMIDSGLLDIRLVARAGPDFLARLEAELGSAGDRSVLYLSQWLSERYHSYLATRTLPDKLVSQSLLLRHAAENDEELVKSRQQRNELYHRVAGLFQSLPGMSAELSEAIVRGVVDDRIEELLLAGALDARGQAIPEESEAARQAQRYDRVVLRAMQLARERAADDDELLFLDTLGRLRSAIFRKSLVRAQRSKDASAGPDEIPAGSGPAAEATLEEARRFMRRELRLVRSLLRIGSHEGRVGSSCAVLLHDAHRTTRAEVAEALRLVREVDPRVGLSHGVLIAPFTGSGFFEWDRDTLVVALSPARSSEEAAVNAVANFRLLADARQGSGRLTKPYRDRYGTHFRDRFLGDYRSWVLRVGRGRREALGEDEFQFFVDHIGPPPGGPVVPAELTRLSVKEREDLVGKLAPLVTSGRADAEELHHLAVLHWQAERIDAAIRTMEQAAALAPEDGRVLYSLGVLCRRRRLLGEARKAFRSCTKAAMHSLWGLYANEALRRLA